VSEEPERWEPISDGPGYEVSWDGNFRAKDRVAASGRRLKAQPIATTRTPDGRYVVVKYRDAKGERVTRQVHRVMLENFAFKGKPIPEGLQSRHYDDNGQNNRWRPGNEEESRKLGGNLFVGDGRDQHRDKVRNNRGPLPVSPPGHDCINHAQCGGKTRNPGKRCVPCVEQVGRDAAAMLNRGENLMKVAQHFGYQRTDWVYSLAVKHGGYTGTKEQAHAQRRTWAKRTAATLRNRLGGDAESPRREPARQQAGRPGTAPFGRVSPPGKLGHSRTSETQNVAERSRSDRPHVPLPAEVTHRNRPPRGGRSR
jgi:hypothetical protein